MSTKQNKTLFLSVTIPKSKKFMSLKKSILVIIVVLLIDQISKIYIKTNFSLHEEVPVFSWFRIVFVENKGMAWGFELPGNYGKLVLTLFRLVAITGIGYWLYDSVRKNSPKILTCLLYTSDAADD